MSLQLTKGAESSLGLQLKLATATATAEIDKLRELATEAAKKLKVAQAVVDLQAVSWEFACQANFQNTACRYLPVAPVRALSMSLNYQSPSSERRLVIKRHRQRPYRSNWQISVSSYCNYQQSV